MFILHLMLILKREILFIHILHLNLRRYNRFYKAVCIQHERPVPPEDCPSKLKGLMELCWAPDPAARFIHLHNLSFFENVPTNRRF